MIMSHHHLPAQIHGAAQRGLGVTPMASSLGNEPVIEMQVRVERVGRDRDPASLRGVRETPRIGERANDGECRRLPRRLCRLGG